MRVVKSVFHRWSEFSITIQRGSKLAGACCKNGVSAMSSAPSISIFSPCFFSTPCDCKTLSSGLQCNDLGLAICLGLPTLSYGKKPWVFLDHCISSIMVRARTKRPANTIYANRTLTTHWLGVFSPDAMPHLLPLARIVICLRRKLAPLPQDRILLAFIC